MRLRPPIIVESDEQEVPQSLFASAERTRATVKIQDGCNLRCAYCAVSLARGPLRSRPLEEVLTELRQLGARGIREVVLTGIRLDAYGQDLPDTHLSDLLDATHDLNISRLRLSSLEPMGISLQLIERMAAHPTLCHHFHICLQSGDDDVLRAMRRSYTVDYYRDLIARIRVVMPEATFSTDIVVGFPGEGDEAFKHTCQFIEEIGFFKLNIFKYSPLWPHMAAVGMLSQVSDIIKEQRSAHLFAIERNIFSSYANQLIGNTVPVLVEHTGKVGDGLTSKYFRVSAHFPRNTVGDIIPVMITGYQNFTLLGTPLLP